MIDIINAITLSVHLLFFAGTVVLGYTDERYSALFSSVVMMFTALSIGSILFYEAFHGKKGIGSIKPYFFPILFVFFYIFDKATSSYIDQSVSLTQFLSSMSYATSGIYIATFCYRHHRIKPILKSFNILMIIQTIAIAISIPDIITSGIASFGLGSYQTLSYFSAFAFGINLHNILSHDNQLKFKFQETKLYKSISILMLLIQITGVFISGGRGGAILLFVNTFVLFYVLSRHNIKKVLVFVLLFIPTLYITVSFASPGLMDMIEQRTERTFSYIDTEGEVDLSETSGRDIIYSSVWDMYTRQPFFGYGIYKQYDMMNKDISVPYVHNIILEIALQGGIVLLMIFLYSFIKHYKKLKVYIKQYPENTIILTIYLYAITFLMFSGTYLGNTYFWFTMTYILIHNLKKTNNINNL